MHTADPENRVPHLAFQPNAMTDLKMLPMDEVQSSYYLRLRIADKSGVLSGITGILADQKISIEAMMQKEPGEGEAQADLIMLTHRTREKYVKAAITQIEALEVVVGNVTKLRMETL
jgi:homoserine dehydrogenase